MINQRGRLEIDKAIPLIVQACAGIGYAHRAGLVHCDVKPQNMLVTPDQRVKVADFGIARALASIQADERSSIVWGSPQYFSPEQAAGKAPSPASDVYGLGVVLYEMLTGQLPFTTNSSRELARLHLEAAPPEPRHINPAISKNLNRIILKVLSKEASARYRTADQLGRVLITFSKKSSPVRLSQPVATERETSKPQPKIEVKKTTPKENDPPVNTSLDMDWVTIGLGLIALVAAGGLIPFWLWVYFSLSQ